MTKHVLIKEMTCELITFTCSDCEHEETIVSEELLIKAMQELILQGINPFTESWEDGIGNTIECNCS